MRKFTRTVTLLEGLKKETQIQQVREILTLAAKVLGVESAPLDDYDHVGTFMEEFLIVKYKAEAKAKKLLAKNPDMTFDELVKRVCKR